MSEKKSGGPAFPELGNVGYKSEWESESGMTLRQYYAGQAMVGIIANFHNIDKSDYPNMPGGKMIAAMAYDIADAMINENDR